MLRKMFVDQVKTNQKIQSVNEKLHTKLSYYIKSNKINQDELEDIMKTGIINDTLIEEVNKWLDLKEGDVDKVDFYEPEVELDNDNSDFGDLKDGSINNHIQIGTLEPIIEKKIERPHLLFKSHSFNLDVRGRYKNNKTFKDLVKTKEEGCLVDDLILYDEQSTQTDISFYGKKYENFIVTQKELSMLYNKKVFAEKLLRIIGDREETNFVRDKEMLLFLEDQLPMYLNEEVANFFEKNYKEIGFLKKTEINPSLKIKEILTSYAYECHKATIYKIKKDEFSKTADLLFEACLKFKKVLVELDEKYSK